MTAMLDREVRPSRGGRKVLPEGKKRQREVVYLTPPVAQFLEKQREQLGMTTVSQALELLIRTHQKYEDVAPQ